MLETATATARNGRLTAACAAGYVALSGGGSVANDTLDASYLSDGAGNATADGGTPTGWTVTWSSGSFSRTGTAYVVCAR